MDRLDKIISYQTNYSRKEIKKLIQQSRIKVNNEIIKKSDIKIDSNKDCICIDEKNIEIKQNIYLVLNKPKGYVSATEDKFDHTILELVPEEFSHRNLFPVGRLDKDTTGLIIITDDGEFAHEITSPNKHVNKKYIVCIDIEITNEMIKGFEDGVTLNDGKCKPAILEKINSNQAIVTISEGKYHQIKRMFGCYGAKVIELKRISIGNYTLPKDIDEGCVRELNKLDIEKIKEK